VADQLVLEQYTPPALLVDDKGNILYVSGRTGKYLEPASGKANWNIFAMAREGLRYELGAAFHKTLEGKNNVAVRGVKIESDGGKQYVDFIVRRLEDPESLRGLVLIVFTDAAVPPEVVAPSRGGRAGKTKANSARLEDLRRKYERAHLEAQTIREETQTSQEELRSINEEQQSTNEELQSTNEELTTSKEEMQSLNEELQTVNIELQAKVDELSRASNDMKNLLNSTDIATLFLDNQLNVRRFTSQATKIIKLLPCDVGRPVTDLASDLLYPELIADARQVLLKLGFSEKPINTGDGRWFTVRIMPYRTLDDRIDGLVMTFADITVAKTLEMQLREKNAVFEKHLTEPSTKPARGKTAGPHDATARIRTNGNGKARRAPKK
jgi:two-component system CheB/CheR fusion protein